METVARLKTKLPLLSGQWLDGSRLPPAVAIAVAVVCVANLVALPLAWRGQPAPQGSAVTPAQAPGGIGDTALR